MIRGTTPTHTFTLPFDVSLIKKIKIIYAQGGEQKFCKRKEDCILDGRTVQTTLTQEETFLLDCKWLVEIQVRVLTVGEDVLASLPMTATVGKCLDSEVLA